MNFTHHMHAKPVGTLNIRTGMWPTTVARSCCLLRHFPVLYFLSLNRALFQFFIIASRSTIILVSIFHSHCLICNVNCFCLVVFCEKKIFINKPVVIMRPSSVGEGAAYCVALCLSVCPSVPCLLTLEHRSRVFVNLADVRYLFVFVIIVICSSIFQWCKQDQILETKTKITTPRPLLTRPKPK